MGSSANWHISPWPPGNVTSGGGRNGVIGHLWITCLSHAHNIYCIYIYTHYFAPFDGFSDQRGLGLVSYLVHVGKASESSGMPFFPAPNPGMGGFFGSESSMSGASAPWSRQNKWPPVHFFSQLVLQKCQCLKRTLFGK